MQHRLEAALVGYSVNECDVLVLFLLYISTNRESLKLSGNVQLDLSAIYILILFVVVVVVWFHFLGSCRVRGRLATGEQNTQ